MRFRYIVGLLLILIFTAIGGFLLFYITSDNRSTSSHDEGITNDDQDIDRTVNGKVQDEDGQFKLNAEYNVDLWEYTITGYLPNPCYSATVTEIIRESYPEQVTVELTVVPPRDGIACIDVVQDFEHKGEFVASREAKIELRAIQ